MCSPSHSVIITILIIVFILLILRLLLPSLPLLLVLLQLSFPHRIDLLAIHVRKDKLKDVTVPVNSMTIDVLLNVLGNVSTQSESKVWQTYLRQFLPVTKIVSRE